jgi:cholesterol oxidase
MKAVPFRHVYDNPVARRIYFIYGDVYRYENINRPTMEQAVPSFFGNGNITFFEHISLMIRASAARNARGEDVYLPNADAYRFPMSFMTGEHNRMFVPKGLQRTYDHLRKANGSEYYTHRVFKDYAHLDCWLGTEAERDVWPTALAELERHN